MERRYEGFPLADDICWKRADGIQYIPLYVFSQRCPETRKLGSGTKALLSSNRAADHVFRRISDRRDLWET